MKIRTLIVEDEPLARRTLREFAAGIDWLVLVGEASDGRAAVELIDALKPDLVLLDVQIPEMSGLEVLNSVKHQPSVIFTTAYDKNTLFRRLNTKRSTICSSRSDARASRRQSSGRAAVWRKKHHRQ